MGDGRLTSYRVMSYRIACVRSLGRTADFFFLRHDPRAQVHETSWSFSCSIAWRHLLRVLRSVALYWPCTQATTVFIVKIHGSRAMLLSGRFPGVKSRVA